MIYYIINDWPQLVPLFVAPVYTVFSLLTATVFISVTIFCKFSDFSSLIFQHSLIYCSKVTPCMSWSSCTVVRTCSLISINFLWSLTVGTNSYQFAQWTFISDFLKKNNICILNKRTIFQINIIFLFWYIATFSKYLLNLSISRKS